MKFVLITLLSLPLIICTAYMPLPGFDGKIKSQYHYMSGRQRNFYYLPDGRLSHTEFHNTKTNFRYSGDTIFWAMEVTLNKQPATSRDTFILNPKGLIERSVSKERIASYTYDENNYRITKQNFHGSKKGACYNYEIVNGNVASERLTPSKKLKRKGITPGTFYDYYPHLANSRTYENAGVSFWGADSKNLVRRELYINADGDTTFIHLFNYHIDSANRVIKSAKYKSDGQLLDSIAYSYY